MAYVSVGEITPISVTFRQSVHSSGGRMSIPKVVTTYLEKEYDDKIVIEIKRGAGWTPRKTVVLESGLEILAKKDAELARIMKPGASLIIRASRDA